MKAIQKPSGESRGRSGCRYLSPDKTYSHTQPGQNAGVFLLGPTTQNKEGNPLCSYNCPMTQATQTTLALLQELLLALRANDADTFFNWLYLGVQELGEPVVTELMMDSLLLRKEKSKRASPHPISDQTIVKSDASRCGAP